MALTHEEARFFKDKPDLYKEAKQRILEKWTADCKAWLTLEACKDACPRKLLDVLPLAFSFLQEHGVINIGAIQSPREHELPTTSAAEEEPKQPTKADIREKLYAILRIADFEVMTEKKIRAQLELELGIDMAPYRAWVRKHVLHVVNNMEERDTLAPLPLTDDDGDEGSNGAKGQQDCKGATTQTLPRAKDALPQDVVVIGAGLAGLVAANVLQRNGVKVIVLESQPHCGGRLAKLANGREAAAQSTAAVPTSDTGLAAAFGAIPLMIPVRKASAVSSEGQAAAEALGAVGGWADAGSFTLTTLCRQLDISLNPLSVATSEGDGDVTEAAVWQPRLYERCMAAEGPQTGVEVGPRVIARQVQDEAEGLLVELLQAVRHRVDIAATAGSNCQPPLRVTLAEELRAALALAVVPIPQSGRGDDRYADASDSQLEGVKRSAAAAAAESGVDAPRKLADGAQDDSSPEDILRSAKRSRGEDAAADRTPGCEGSIGAVQEAEGDGDGAANNRTGMPSGAGDGAPEGSGEAAATQPEGAPQQIADTAARNAAEGAPVVKTTDGQGAGDQARRSNSQEAGDDQEAPPSAKRHVRQEVLSVLHNHLLPLLELYLCAPLSAMAPDQLALLPYWLPGIGRPIGPALAGESTQQAPPGLLPAGAVSKLVGALAAQLSDVRTGLTVTSVTVTANGVKILTKAAGTLTAAAAILAVPHAVIQTGSIRIDPALPPYRAAAAARISCGCAATLTLVFPPGTNLSPLTAGAKASAAPFMVSSALPLDGADTTVAGGGPVPAGAAATTSSHPQRMGFMFCRMAAEESAESAATRGEGEVVLTAHLVGTSAEQAASLSDEDLQRHVMTALQDAAAAAAADALPNAPVVTANELGTPLRCHVTRWGCDASTSSANASSRLTAAQRGSGCAHLGPGGHPRDMQLLALPHKARVFFAGEHTAPQHLRTGLMAAMAASGVREAARVLQALRSSATAKAGGATAKGKAAAAAAAVAAATSLAVWDEQPHDELMAAAEAAAAALAARRGSEKDTGGKGSGSGSGAKRAAEGGLGTKGKVTGKKKDMDISDGDEDGSESATAPKRRKQGDVEGAEQAGRKGKGKTDAASVDAKEKTKTKLASKGGKAKVEEDEDEDASGSGSSGSEAEDEEEEGAEEEEEEEATVGRGKKGKAKRGSSSAQERKQKDKKPTKEKEGKRRRGGDDNGNGSDGDSQDEEEAGAGKAETGKRAKGGRERKEDPVQLGILDKQRRQQALAKLQADRKDLKVVYKAMMAAGNGNMAPLREQMATSGGLDAKQLMLQALQGASMPVLQRLASDGQVHTVLKDWLLELSDEVSAEHLVLAELRFLERLPFSTDALTAALSPATTSTADAEGAEEDGDGGGGGGSGDEGTPLRALVTVVRERCGSHRGKDVKRLAAHLVASWERRVNATGGGLSTSGITTAAAAAAGAGSATTAPGPGGPPRPAPAKFDPRALVSLRKAALATAPTTTVPATRLTPPPPAARHTQSHGSSDAATGPGSTAAVEPTSGAPAAPALDPALEARLLAAKSAAEAARQEAALAAQRRAEVQQEAQAGASKRVASLPEIATFEDFKRFERVTGGINSVGEGASGKHHRESGSGSARPHKGSSGSASGSAAGGGSSDLEALKLEVLEFTKQLLRHHHKAGKITTAGYRLILDKASRKVIETLTPSSSSGSHGGSKGDLLGSKRREKIRKLVDQYVQKMGAQEGGAGVGGGSSGVGPPRASLAHVHEGSGGGVMDTGGETPLPPPPPPPPASLLPPPMSMTLQPSPSQLPIQLTMSSPIQLTFPPPPAPLTISPSPSQLTMSPPVQLTMPPPPAQLPLPPPSILITMPPPPPYLPPPPPGLV